MGKFLTSTWMVGLVLIGLIGIRTLDPEPVERIRNIQFDSFLTSYEPTISDNIILLDVGENSLEEFGQWPFPRQQFAQMISDLRNANAGMIGMTVMFPEPDRFGGDQILASWINGNGIILGQTSSPKGRSDVAPFVGTATLGEGSAYDFAYEYKGIVTNLPEFESASWGVGMMNSSPEVDGITRRVPLVTQVSGQLYPSFPIEVVRANADKKSYTMKVETTGIENFRIPPYEPIVTDYAGSIWLDWSKDFIRYEYGETLPNLQGKTVIVGVTAEGIVPIVSTPKGSVYPHEIQASAIETIMGGVSISRPNWGSLLEIGLILIGSLLMMVSFGRLGFASSILVSLTAVSGVVYSSFYFWNSSMFLIDFTFPIITLILIFSQLSFNNFYKQFKLRQQIKGQFGTYLSPDMVDMLVKDPSLMKLGGDRKEMTFLFADIVGFTPISEKYMQKDDPEGLVELINMFLDRLTKIILKNGGTVDKYMGDCIMAFWNAPLPCENHAEMAVRTAIEMELVCEELNQELQEKGLDLPLVKIGTGVNTGPCIVGNMGSESRFDYSVVGDAVNLGARLEVQTREYDTPILLSEYTYMQTEGISCKDLGEIKVKGKDEPVTIYAPLFDAKSGNRKEIRKLYKDGI